MLHENNYIVGSQVGRESFPISVAKIYKHICGLQDCIVVVFANEKSYQNCQNSSEFVFGEYPKLIKFKQICFSENNDADNKNPYLLECSKSPYCVVVSKYVFGSGSGSVVFKFLCSKNSPTEKNQLRKYFRITSHK